MQSARYLHANFGHVYLRPPQWLIVEGWVSFFITARNEVGARLCFYRHL